MIRLRDAALLASTKLKTRRIRTGFVIGVSGLLFGLMIFAVLVMQGVFDSVDRFSGEGLNGRSILQVTRPGGSPSFDAYEERSNPQYINEVQNAYDAYVARKQAAAKKFGIIYDPKQEDPSPIGRDPDTKQMSVLVDSYNSPAVQEVLTKKAAADYKPFDIRSYVRQYPSAKVLGDQYKPVTPKSGNLTHMKDGKEKIETDLNKLRMSRGYTEQGEASLTITDGSITQPFVTSTKFDPSKGEIPIVVPYSDAEKMLGYKKLSATTSSEEKVQRLKNVRERINEVTATFCYRNQASQAKLSEASSQVAEIKRGKGTKDFVMPKVVYELPSDTSCGPVKIVSDTRTASEKRMAEARIAFEKEVGTYIGDPDQRLVTVRGVGISGDSSLDSSAWSITGFVGGLFGSSLGYGTWSIPSDLMTKLPEAARPPAIFANENTTENTGFYPYETYLVEFSDRQDARKLLEKTGSFTGGMGSGDIMTAPFGSSVLLVDEFKKLFYQIMLWAFAVISVIAAIIVGAIIGRAVSDGRRESAIFRAIGARRGDIGLIYGTYAFLLSLRVVLFAFVLGIVGAFIIELWLAMEASFAAQLAYAASNTSLEFHFVGFGSWYLAAIGAAIVGVGLVSSIIPILLGARRSPINDMRDDT